MSKPSKIRRQPVELRPSRIRRDPARVESVAQPRPESPEREVWGAVLGVVLFALVGTALVLGFGAITNLRRAAPAEPAGHFNQCYNGGANCVVDGDTIYFGGTKIEIAGMDAPEIRGAACPEETSRGIDAAVRLLALLNSGKVTIAGPEREPDGQVLTKVEVDGEDVGDAMISAGMARDYGSGRRSWCSEGGGSDPSQ
jgi:endonuclease YncB( thermonuclease family)